VIPILETERLRLRGHRLDDFEDCVKLWADPGVTRYIGGKPSSREMTWARLLRYAGHWSLLGFGYWVVEEKASGDFAGEVGFADFKRDMEPPIDVPELGWVLVPRMHGKGYGTEAVRAAVAWGDRHFGSARSMCMIAPENTPSIRVAQKVGFREIVRTTYKDEPTLLFERD